MKRRSLLFSSLVLAIALAVGVGCGKKPNDATISSAIQVKFSQDSGLSNKQLTVQANNGVVTLGGTVDDEAQREAASRQASSVAGVKEVVNNLQVGNSAVAAAVATPASTRAASTEREGRGISRKSRRHRESADSDADTSTINDSNSGQMSADRRPTETPSPVSEMPPNSAAPVQTAPPPPPPP